MKTFSGDLTQAITRTTADPASQQLKKKVLLGLSSKEYLGLVSSNPV